MISVPNPPASKDVQKALKQLHLDRCRPATCSILVKHFTRPAITVCMSSENRRSYAKAVRKVVKEAIN